MALIHAAQRREVVAGAVALDLADLTRQGEAIVARARAEGERIVAEARRERERLITGAAAEGHAQGLAQGLAEGRARGRDEGYAAALAERSEQLARLQRAWESALAEFTGRRDAMLLEAKQDVVRLAVRLAERVTRRIAEGDPGVIAAQVQAVLARVVRPTRLVIRLHPSREELARAALPRLLGAYARVEHVEIVADPDVPPDACIARTAAGGEIDASIGTQVERLARAILAEPLE